MNFGIYSYAVTVVAVPGLAFLLYLAMKHLSPKNGGLSARDWSVILKVILMSIVFTAPGEAVALALRAWTYNPQKTLHTILFGAEIETYLFSVAVALVVSIATILYSRREDRKRTEFSA